MLRRVILPSMLAAVVAGCPSAYQRTYDRDLAALQAQGRFMLVTAAGLRESHPHDVIITKEAPNYRLS